MKYVIYKDSDDEFRWQLVTRNGKIVAVSGEGYKNKKDVEKIIKKIQESEASVTEDKKTLLEG